MLLNFISNILAFTPGTFLRRMPCWFYAVARGRKIGVFTTWDSCLKQVESYSNAKYKKFKTREAADAFIEECKLFPTINRREDNGHLTTEMTSPPSYLTAISSSDCSSPEIPVVNESLQEHDTNTSKGTTAVRRHHSVLSNCNDNAQGDLGNVSPEALAALVADDFTFTTDMEQKNTRNDNTDCSAGVGEKKCNNCCVKVEKYLSEIKMSIDHIFQKMCDLENKVQEITGQKKERMNTNKVQPNTSISEMKKSLLKNYNIPQAVEKRQFSSSKSVHDNDIEVVPRKKLKRELNCEEVDTSNKHFNFNEDGYLVIYTDGACVNNGKRGAKAGIGVWFGDDNNLNCSEPVIGRPTNNTAEIQAAVKALLIAKNHGFKKILIRTDSEFMINCITKWIHKWKKNGWKVATGAEVKNKEELIQLMDIMQGLNVKWEHVRGHRGIHGNEMADSLASAGVQMYQSK